ncbi:MAG: Multidomain signal transduction protein including CheB-like methylesterase, CheR-like methyltransferase and BaeS-like histidine kinase [uncultured Paraburkholderia sp.]|nr:MAG: Multidomain signal transduction protein including CheB-like methylesterase, CheR-like methyltransferase and BaeS-like histidine kinase [uncultured Paraburkholderia sp.]CAH2938608.1 MAG: Multidomain signal transduction protein including CheB-like methylesterase, CheR-like methyltransferase and BaeS-like histidine kinase [uncultured Paraburkholderia sp.]
MPQTESSRTPGPDFAVIGIGASAGGVQALLRLFETMPDKPGVAFVVVLHLSPDYASNAQDVIQHVTRLHVQQVSEPVLLEKDHVYVISPGKQLSMVDGYLRLTDPVPPRLPPTTIDVFFRSLADAHGARAVAIVLSGMGTDGSVGIARIRERGGITIAQRPEEAEYGDMPRNAIATGDVDLVLPLAEIAPYLLKLVSNASRIELPASSDPDDSPSEEQSADPDTGHTANAVDEVLETLHTRTRHDFSGYKRGTLLRRIERRMQVNGLASVEDYRSYLTANVDETPKLLSDMLIGVTNFFRDPEAFNALEATLVTELTRSHQKHDELRAWVPACATGEEAFSIAIILDEVSRRLPHRPRVTVFATDIDERAIAIARAASYPAAIVNDVSPERLRRYFVAESSRFRVVKSLRDTIIFAAHNLLRDPPFSRVDLISCRNLLIYLGRRAQSRVLESFHFSLRPNGLLFLGTAESADLSQDCFSLLNKHNKIYRVFPRAVSGSLLTYSNFQLQPFEAGGQTFFSLPSNSELLDRGSAGQMQALDLFGPAVIVVKKNGAIIHCSANANRLTLDFRRTRVTNLFHIVRDDAQGLVRTALERCLTTGARVDEQGVPFTTAWGDIPVDLSLRPYRDSVCEEDVISLTCDLPAGFPMGSKASSAPGDETQDAFEQGLPAIADQLQDAPLDAQDSAEELRASNEELQAMNEELVTVNSELVVKVQESARVSDDLKNLIALVGVATVFVDRTLNIKRYTSPAETLFNILQSDAGRPLQHLTHNLDYPDMVADLRTAFETLHMIEKEVQSNDGRTFLARVIPYHTDDDRIDGAVLALIDISEQKAVQRHAMLSEEKLKLAVQETHDFAIIVLDDDGLVVSWNVGASRIFGFQAEEMKGRTLESIFTPEDVADGVPMCECNKARADGRAEDERWHVTRSGERVFCSGFLSRVTAAGFSGFAKIVHDATGRKLSEGRKDMALARERADNTEVRKLSRLKDEFIAVLSHELKNPLNLIHMKAEILARIPEAKNISRIRDIADAIQRSVLSQGQLIDDLLDFSRIQTGKLSLRFAPTDVARITRAIVEGSSADFLKNDIELTIDVPASPEIIQADAVRVEQIVWNLVSNALKFTPSGGKVWVTLRREADKVRLEVADTGMGIAPHLLESIFDIFEQAPNVPSRGRAGGLGIGLSLVRQLAQLHGGTASAFSAGLGTGTRFVVWLPADADSAHRQAGDTPPDLAFLKGHHVLVIDDSRETLQAMADLFSLYEAKVEIAANAARAFERVRDTAFDLIITDINLPDLDGYQIVSQLRKMPECAGTAIVVLTGRPIDREELLARQAGCDAFLQKPFNLESLATAMRSIRKSE